MVRFDLAIPADIRFGASRVSEVPEALLGHGASRVMVVTGRTTSRADAVQSALSQAGVSSIPFGVATEPSIERVRAAVELLTEAGCDAVLGYGGGSAIDVAKAVAVLATTGTDPREHLEVIGAGRPIERPGLPCVAVPTTAGTGSEVTRNSVLSGDGVKASLRSPLMLPKVSVIDSDLLIGLPAPTIAASGMDALSQLIEPLLSRRANPFSDALARDGIRRSARSLRRAYQEGMEDPGVREDLAIASLFGGLRRPIQTSESTGIDFQRGLKFSLCFRQLPHLQQQSAELFADRNERAWRNGMFAEYIFGIGGPPQHFDCFVLLAFSCCHPCRRRLHLQIEMTFEIIELWMFCRVA